ncbi:MAG: beta-ketoacyl synthase [Lewinellaceae bacterium]|nr:hypothetical protein [Saprospiraceae bacterium]MCB9337036.1 beta-ketoacyl synthase [Lewinellaceae bacterium]
MNETFIVADNVTTPLGWTTGENFGALLRGQSGIRCLENSPFSPTPLYAAVFEESALEATTLQAARSGGFWSKFERLVLYVVSDALSQTDLEPSDRDTVFILSTTKGNIELLEEANSLSPDLLLHHTARKIAQAIGHKGNPVVLSHACVSGLAAILVGMRLLRSGRYKHAIVAGADLVSRFVVSGFQSFHALSNEPCRPFDQQRKGLNLGEAGGAVVLSIDKRKALVKQPIRVKGGTTTNDANHISGPSRTGEELAQAIARAMKQAGTPVDFISAHGTATPYNDEMEAKAFYLSGLQEVPLNSMKGYFGHTLGAAGLIESVMSVESLRENAILPSLGYDTHGVSQPVNVNRQTVRRPLQACLKTASGFGGCNAAVVFGKD